MITAYANPKRLMTLLAAILPVAGAAAAVSIVAGVWYAFFNSPPDYQQGDMVRVMYIHVPAAWMALFIYATMAAAAFCGLVWRHVAAELYARAAAPAGAVFTLICLLTGSIWGKPIWGTWWVWDARLTSVLVLLFLYLGYMVLIDAFEDEQRGTDAGAILLLAGAVNLPVIKFSVDWWHTLHQPASIMRLDAPAIDASMLTPLFLMAAGFKALFVCIAILRLRAAMANRRRAAREAAA